MKKDIQRIKLITLEILAMTSKNDPQRGKLQFIIDACDELLTHHIDDGR